MSIARTHFRKKNRGTGQKIRQSHKTQEPSENAVIEQPGQASVSVIEQSLETSTTHITPNEILTEGWELSDQLVQLIHDCDTDSPPKHKGGHDDCTFQIIEGDIHKSSNTAQEAFDTSKRFERDDAESIAQAETQQEKITPDITLSDAAHTVALGERSPGPTACASTGNTADEKGLEIVASNTDDTNDHPRSERRRHTRQDRADLVWVEYFNSSMESTGREAARADNVGAGGMRVTVKTAPSDLERVIVSYPFRGFESCAIVRGRYQAEDGHERLCVEFSDRNWVVSTSCAPAEYKADQIAPRKKILLADDDSTFRKILGDILGRAGYDVVLAEDGEKALEKAANENPDLVITDGLMPKLHGFELCKAVKELHPETRVIMLTAIYTSPNYRWEAHSKFHVDELITKPCQISDLLRKIEGHMPSATQGA